QLADIDIIKDLINFNLSDFEDEGRYYGDHLHVSQQEAIPPVKEEELNESDDVPLSSLRVEPQSLRNDSIRWKHTASFDFTPDNDQLNV
ncbi:unnamed protein product, partial [Parnassius apollo]